MVVIDMMTHKVERVSIDGIQRGRKDYEPSLSLSFHQRHQLDGQSN